MHKLSEGSEFYNYIDFWVGWWQYSYGDGIVKNCCYQSSHPDWLNYPKYISKVWCCDCAYCANLGSRRLYYVLTICLLKPFLPLFVGQNQAFIFPDWPLALHSGNGTNVMQNMSYQTVIIFLLRKLIKNSQKDEGRIEKKEIEDTNIG